VAWFPTALEDNVHTYGGFIMAGLSILHTYLNRAAIKRYFKQVAGITK